MSIRPFLRSDLVKEQEHSEEREKCEKEIDPMKEAISAKIKEVDELVDGYVNLITARPEDMSAAEMLSSADEIEAKIKASKQEIANVQEKIKALKEVNAWFQGATQTILNKAMELVEWLDLLSRKIKAGREEVVKEAWVQF
jgi:prophage DNA circulation protein